MRCMRLWASARCFSKHRGAELLDHNAGWASRSIKGKRRSAEERNVGLKRLLEHEGCRFHFGLPAGAETFPALLQIALFPLIALTWPPFQIPLSVRHRRRHQGRSLSFLTTAKRSLASTDNGALPGRSRRTVYTPASLAAWASVCMPVSCGLSRPCMRGILIGSA